MKRQKFIFALLIAVFIGFSVQQTFAQKKGGVKKDNKKYEKWKKDKVIEFQPPPPKQLLVEVTVNGSGNYRCHIPIATCTWKIDRKYSATIDLKNALKEPFYPMMSEPGTASEIAQAKVMEKAKANPAAAFNTKWYNLPANPMNGAFDVYVSINDETKETWKVKKKGNIVEEQFIIKTWKAENIRGKGSGAEVTLNRQLGAFRFFAALAPADAEMIHEIQSSGEDSLPIRLPVFDVPRIEGKLENYVTLPFSRGVSDDEKNASFDVTFSDLQYDYLGFGIPETKAATITVTYKFK